MDELIAHIKSADSCGNQSIVQILENHSFGVASLAKMFASEFGMGEWGYVTGLLHDKGKEQKSFQDYIRIVNGIPADPLNGRDKSHAYVGSLLAIKKYGSLGNIIANQIAGHHAGMFDYDELESILTKEIPSDVCGDFEKLNLPVQCFKVYNDVSALNHLYRMLFSCLVDADFLDTERFMDDASYNMRLCSVTMPELKLRLDTKLDSFKSAPDTPVNRIRKQVQEECLKASSLPSGFFSLTVPTGGGKTISSIVWAINHAIKNGKRRIIIAIPYTSIIVQTAAVLKGIFGEENVLEHHSSSDYEMIKDAKLRQRMKLATENWDYPIVVTTNVQLFESVYSNKPSDCRKLHNISNSILILDEVQTLPTEFLQPIVDALKCYQKHFGVSVLFTTASQPILSGLIEGCNPNNIFLGIESIREIIPEGMNLHDSLRRVALDIDNNGATYSEIAEKLKNHKRVLCIVNTRRDAKEIFDRLPDEGIKIHLSRMMCPAHIRKTIEKIKSLLFENADITIRVIATQLIEAGVDIDFPVVYRQETGLDSILQAAGRCNREGKLDICCTYVFSLSKERPLPRGSMQDANNARLALGKQADWFAPATMTQYFQQLYCRKQSFDEKDIKGLLYKPNEMCFESAANEFHLIDDNGITVIVNWETSMDLVNRLRTDGPSYKLMKQLGQYSVSIHEKDFKMLQKCGAVEEVSGLDGTYLVADRSQYDGDVGLLIGGHWLEEIMII